jgi:hypothetical protein
MKGKLLDLRTARIATLKASLGMFMAEVAETIIPRMQEKDETDTGGYLAVCDRETGLPLLVIPVGQFVSGEKAQRYLTNCLEKAERLSREFRERGHLTSWQSRDPDDVPSEHRKRYGGAIIVGDLIYSFSGFSEHGDEWAGLTAADYNHTPVDLLADVRRRAAEISNNSYLLAA